MFRRRRAFSRRSASSRGAPINRAAVAGGLAIALIGGFVYLVHVADSNPPARTETRIDMPNALESQ